VRCADASCGASPRAAAVFAAVAVLMPPLRAMPLICRHATLFFAAPLLICCHIADAPLPSPDISCAAIDYATPPL
jgi:hypothetical protein